MPELLAAAGASRGSREEVTSDWSRHLDQHGFNSAHIDKSDVTRGASVAAAVAADAWRFSERLGLIDSDGVTPEGSRLSALAGSPGVDNVRRATVAVLARGVARQLRGTGKLEVLPLLRAGARALATTTNLWARQCPGLIPVEVSSLIHWGSVDAERAQRLLSSLVTWRDVAMHPYGEPEDSAPPQINANRHFEAVSAFHLSHPWLGERAPLSSAEETATCRLLAYCGLLRLVEADAGPACWLLAADLSEDGVAC